jgi:Flp pilus assembly protein TadB
MQEEKPNVPPTREVSIWTDLWAVTKIIALGVLWLVLMVFTYYSLLTIPVFLLVICLGLLVYRSIRAKQKHDQYSQEE